MPNLELSSTLSLHRAADRAKLALMAGKDSDTIQPSIEVPAEAAEATEFTPLLRTNIPSIRRDWRNITFAVIGTIETMGRLVFLIETIIMVTKSSSAYSLASPIIFLVAWVYATLLPIAQPALTTPYTLLFIYLASIISDFGAFYAVLASGSDWKTQITIIGHITSFLLSGACTLITLSFPMQLNGTPEVNEEGLKPALDDYANLWEWLTFSWMTPFVSLGVKNTVEERDVWQISHLLRSRIIMTKFRHFHRKTLLRRIISANFFDIFIDFALSVMLSPHGFSASSVNSIPVRLSRQLWRLFSHIF